MPQRACNKVKSTLIFLGKGSKQPEPEIKIRESRIDSATTEQLISETGNRKKISFLEPRLSGRSIMRLGQDVVQVYFLGGGIPCFTELRI